MKIDTQTLLLIGIGVILLTQNRQSALTPATIPPEPRRGTPEHDKWTALITGAFGFAKWLFGPGGPFEGNSEKGVSAAIARANDSPFGNNIFGGGGGLSGGGGGFSYG